MDFRFPVWVRTIDALAAQRLTVMTSDRDLNQIATTPGNEQTSVDPQPTTASMGVLYVATGSRYIEEASTSARSLRNVAPAIRIHLYSDQEPSSGIFDQVDRMLDFRYNCHDKVPPLLHSPFEKTVFLDTDTYICGSLHELECLLDRYDLLICHTAFRDPNPIEGIPSAFTEFNTGMIAFRKNERTSRFLRRWLELYDEMGHRADQPSFRRALWEDDQLRFYTLTPEYNFRTIFPGFIGGGSEVKIIHGRHRDWERIRRRLNKTKEPRVVILSPLDRWGRRVIVLRKWSDLVKTIIKRWLLR